MGGRRALVSLLWLNLNVIICISLIGCRSDSASPSPSKYDALSLLGVAPQDEEYYIGGWSSSGTLKCKDGSKLFLRSELNDDFCDCPDASDEPGTSACPNGKFYCKNAGHVPLSIYSSRVNDGICDCCDGSDEYDGKIKCPNTCWEAGRVARGKLKKKIATYQEGVTIRKSEVEQAKLAIAKEEAELSKLKSEEQTLKGLVEQLKARKEQIDRAEEKERLQKEKEEKESKEAEEAKLMENKPEDKADIVGENSENDIHDKDVVEDREKSSVEVEHISETIDEVPLRDEVEQAKGKDGKAKDDTQQHAPKEKRGMIEEDKAGIDAGNEGKTVTENTLSREELGRRVASRWTGEKTEEETKEVDATIAVDHENHEPLTEDHDEEYNSYDSEDEEHKYDDEDDNEEQTEDLALEDEVDSSSSYKYEPDEELDLSDLASSSDSSWLEKIKKYVHRIIQAVIFFPGHVDKSEAASVRKEYDESSTRLSKIQSRISSLTKKLKQDFGPEKEFYSFYGQCYESKQNKYAYKICPFKEASQTEGYSSTRLGNWEKFEDSYRAMQFSNGDKCWNGPDRSLKVKLRCGLKNEVSDVDEPSRCEYIAFFSTPALCHEEKLKELQEKLEMMNKEQPKSHDEL